MNTAVRLCIAFALHAMTVAYAGLQPSWSQRFTSSNLTHNVQVTRFDTKGDVIVGGTIIEGATGADLWVTKLDGTTGAVIWTFRKDGLDRANDKLGGLVIASDGDIYVAGALANEATTTGTPGTDAYLARLKSASGEPIWESNALGNLGDDAWHDVTLDGSSNPVVTGLITNVENNLGGEIWTANFDAADGIMKWEATHFAFETAMLDQGERIFVAPNGDIYVQGFHSAGTFLGVNYQPTVQVLSYEADGKFRWATRFREAPNGRAYGFLPAPAGGFIVGLLAVPPQANIAVITIASGKVDGTFGTEGPLPSVNAVPVIALAENGDVFFTGREIPAAGQSNAVAGRLAPDDFSVHWVKSLPAPGTGPAGGFAHRDFPNEGSVLAAVAGGASTLDLAIATFTKEGNFDGSPLFLDGAAAGAHVTDLPPSGPAMDTDALGGLVVAVAPIGPEGEREVLVRRLRMAGAPTIAFTNPDPGNPNVDAFTAFQIAAAAADPDNDAVSVEFFADGISLGSVATAPFQIAHTFGSTGTHTLEAIATDATSAKTSTGPITVVAHVPIPVVNTAGAQRTGATVGLFSGTAANLPLGGTARFVFGFTAPTVDFAFNTASINLPPNPGGQTVQIPFTFPEPHRSYDYFLQVTATDGTEVVTGQGGTQSFLIPNAPVLAQPDVIFLARGAITGNAQANDLDGDAGEFLTVTYGNGPFPGSFVTKGNTFTFVPGRDFTGELVVPYTIDDGHGSTVVETLVIRNGLHYAGFYRALPPADSPRLGAVDATVNRAGRATVVAYLDGARFAASAELKQQDDDHVGFSAVLRKRNQPDRMLRLSWTADRQLTAQLTQESVLSEAALLTEGALVTPLTELSQTLFTAHGVRAGLSAFPVPQVYTLMGAHNNVAGNAVGRVSAFASLQIATDGKAAFRGKLGDGTAFVTRSRVGEDGQLPIYTSLQARPASFLVGLIQPDLAGAASVSPGLAAVQGPATGATPAYAADYRDLVTFAGPRYVPPSIGGSPLTFSTTPLAVNLAVSGGGVAALNYTLPVWVNRIGRISGIAGITRISVDARTGEISGAFLPQGRRRTLPFSGILRPSVNGGMGIFRGASAMGEIEIAPQ